ncbi:MAG: hypothetical protein PW789_05305 [Edaphobacter sp.]|uniref:hypothetical protein n=1 Tax=Edaphobacter sp. TaxID=1934404 RepID=UPI0023A765E6|nr:hypothetical protein [Edaphobacter sp.]MDE1176007.1 hypothetical protein [Edaphobacter sp.]
MDAMTAKARTDGRKRRYITPPQAKGFQVRLCRQAATLAISYVFVLRHSPNAVGCTLSFANGIPFEKPVGKMHKIAQKAIGQAARSADTASHAI